MIKLNANTKGLEGFSGAVEGILRAVESDDFQGNFMEFTMNDLKEKFMADTIASHLAGNKRITHMFDWPDQDTRGVATGTPSARPLFALNIRGGRRAKFLSFTFLPTNTLVPLQDPAKYGFPASKLQHLKRHRFRMKALVMETHTRVVVKPKPGNTIGLFIPDADSPRGYYISKRPTHPRPGGDQATGGFAEWWTMWFQGPATLHLKSSTNKAEELIQKTGQTVIREVSSGRFTTGKATSIGYVNSSARTAEMRVKAAGRKVFN